jgi:hypothetical protein
MSLGIGNGQLFSAARQMVRNLANTAVAGTREPVRQTATQTKDTAPKMRATGLGGLTADQLMATFLKLNLNDPKNSGDVAGGIVHLADKFEDAVGEAERAECHEMRERRDDAERSQRTPWTFIFEPVRDLLRGVAGVAKGVLGALEKGWGTLRGWF